MRRILVLRGGALGDFLVTLPALAALRRRWPAARIVLAGNATAAVLGREAGLVDEIISQHERRWVPLFGPPPLPGELQRFLDGFDLVLNYWPDPDASLRRHFPSRPGQRFLGATALPREGPAAAHYGAPLRELGLTPDRLVVPLAAPAVAPEGVALHPGSGSPAKNWPLARWAELARWLRAERGARLFVVSGEAEPADVLAGVGEAWRGLPLPELRDRLARCRFFVGHDSGIAHLAAAVGTPGVLLFGPSDPAIWAPPVATLRVVRAGADLADLSVPAVTAAIAAAWPGR